MAKKKGEKRGGPEIGPRYEQSDYRGMPGKGMPAEYHGAAKDDRPGRGFMTDSMSIVKPISAVDSVAQSDVKKGNRSNHPTHDTNDQDLKPDPRHGSFKEMGRYQQSDEQAPKLYTDAKESERDRGFGYGEGVPPKQKGD